MPKRDPDLFRKLLLSLEKQDFNGVATYNMNINAAEVGDYSDDMILYHLRQLVQEEMLDKGSLTASGSLVLRGLTPKAHDFLEATRDDGVWAQVKGKIANAAGGATISVLTALGTEYLKQKLGLT